MAITVGIARSAAQLRTDENRRGFCCLGTTGEARKSPVIRGARIYCHVVSTRRRDDDVEVSSYVAETADRLHDRLAAVSSGIQGLLEDDIPELRGDARIVELLGASVEGNVETSKPFCTRCATTSPCSGWSRQRRHWSMRAGWPNTASR